MRADVVQIGPIRQCILRDQIYISPVKNRVVWLLRGGNKTLAENHVGRVETARIGASVQDCVSIHLRVNQFALRFLQQLFPKFFVVTQLAVRSPERGSEHIVPKPVSE